MKMEKITNLEVQEFLCDFEDRSEISILEEGQEKSELQKMAETKGMRIKDSRDLAVFKTIYAFTDKANSNGAILPKKELLRVLPQIIGKPININHSRRLVVGHYIDYKYLQKENKVIAYGVFYKSNFGDEWTRAQELFKQKKLSSSFEIWSPEGKRENLGSGNYKLHQMEIAGGALIYEDKNNEPAFKNAKVLSMAKKTKVPELVYASKYREDEIITSNGNYFKESVERNHKKLQEEKEKLVQPQVLKIKCSNCQEEQEHTGLSVKIKCTKCSAIIDQKGVMQYPPQVMDFKMLCPSCRTGSWLILSKQDDKAKVRCSQCLKEYEIAFEIIKSKDILNHFHFVYTGAVSCYQCNSSVNISGTSVLTSRLLKCPKCGLEFTFDITRERYKKISKINEIEKIAKASKGGNKMEYVLELSKYHRYVDDMAKLDKAISEVYEEDYKEIAKKLTHQERLALPDKSFAMVVKIKDKATGKMKKVRMFLIHDEVHVKNELSRLERPVIKATLEKLGVSMDKVRAKILSRAKQLKMDSSLEKQKAIEPKKVEVKEVEKVVPKVEKKTVSEKAKAEEKAKASKPDTIAKEEIETLNLKVASLEQDIAKMKKETTERIDFYKSNAKKIYERRAEVDEEFLKDLSDEDILNDDKFEKAKLEKEISLLKASSEQGTDLVGTKPKNNDYYRENRKKIDDVAFPKK